MPTAYQFKVNLHGHVADPNSEQADERDVFGWMLHKVTEQCQYNPHLTQLPRRKIKDQIYRNNTRESFLLDQAT